MPERDFYEILEVPRDATADQIKKAYRSMARKYHPDVNPGDKTAEGKFKEAQNAYDILSNAEKKAAYDRYGHAAFDGMAAAGGGGGARASAADWTSRFGEPGYETIDFSEFFGPSAGGAGRANEGGGIFDDLLGRMRGGRAAGPRVGQSVQAELTIPFLTAVRGGETSVDIQRASGEHESLVVKVPPGVDTGAKLRLKGQGEPGPKGAAAGDLTITITVEPHPYFKREGSNLTVEVPISVGEAILGSKVDVPTLEGARAVTIPPGSSSGQKLRLKGQGVAAPAGKPPGDLFVALKVTVPRNVDDESRKLIEEFQTRNPTNPRAGLW